MQQLLTPKQVAELLNCKTSTIYAWAKTGKVPSFKLEGILRFDPAEIEHWVKACRTEPEPAPELKAKHLGDNELGRIIKDAISSTKNGI